MSSFVLIITMLSPINITITIEKNNFAYIEPLYSCCLIFYKNIHHNSAGHYFQNYLKNNVLLCSNSILTEDNKRKDYSRNIFYVWED